MELRNSLGYEDETNQLSENGIWPSGFGRAATGTGSDVLRRNNDLETAVLGGMEPSKSRTCEAWGP